MSCFLPILRSIAVVGLLSFVAACGGESTVVEPDGLGQSSSLADGYAYSKDAGTTGGIPPSASKDTNTLGPGASEDSKGGATCTKDCFGKQCGPDGCGAQCGFCTPGYVCSTNQLCVQNCTPSCNGKQCGSNGCGGSCGNCASNQACSPQGICKTTNECAPSCFGKQCGPDGCGGKCGICGAGKTCNAAQQCTGSGGGCVPSCTGKQCGGDGCGGNCGKCGPGQVCDGSFKCVKPAGACGDVPNTGKCAGNTVKWCFNNKVYTLNCDPNVGLTCGWSETQKKYDCIPEGCNPNCNGKACGPDGCGGKCGMCPAGENCTASGQCQAVGGGDPEPGQGCGDVTFEGQCDGTTLKYCANDELVVKDCATEDNVCGFDEDFGWYDCVEGDPNGQPDPDPDPDPAPQGCGNIYRCTTRRVR